VNEAEEQVLEHALRELLDQKTTDLPQVVLKALRSSPEAESGIDTTGAATPRRRRWPVPAAAIAATGLALFSLYFVVAEDPAQGLGELELVASASQAIDVLHAGDPVARMQSSFRPGETLVNGPTREQRITLATGESILLGRCSMLTFEQDASGLRIAPLVGEVTIETSRASDLRVRTELGEIALNQPGSLRVELIADGYGLEHPDLFQQLAKEIHMKSSLAFILTLVTVLEGTALLDSADGARSLTAGETLREEQEVLPVAAIRARLLDAIGMWDLTVTEIGRDGQRGRVHKGEEYCGAGPGDKWLVTDTTLLPGGEPITIHTVVGYDPRNKIFTGTLFDSFGGEMGLLRGTPGKDLDSRTLSMYSEKSTPGFDIRWHMRWIGPDERQTRMEILQDEEWVLVRELVHRRRE